MIHLNFFNDVQLGLLKGDRSFGRKAAKSSISWQKGYCDY